MVRVTPQGESEVASSGQIIEPSEVADAVVDTVRGNRFLVLPHPEVHDYEQLKVGDRDRWLAGMRYGPGWPDRCPHRSLRRYP